MTAREYFKNVGKKFQDARIHKKLSPSELADLADVDESDVVDVESGSKFKDIIIYRRMAIALGKQLSDFFEE